VKEQNKKRTPTLAGKVVLIILILTLSIATFYNFNKLDAERSIIEQELTDITNDIEYIKARQLELEAMLNHAEFIDTSEVETSSIQK
jgi:CHASE1-domain containing sensor protein